LKTLNRFHLPVVGAVKIGLRRSDVRMAHQGMNGSEVVPFIQKGSGKGMPNHVSMNPLPAKKVAGKKLKNLMKVVAAKMAWETIRAKMGEKQVVKYNPKIQYSLCQNTAFAPLLYSLINDNLECRWERGVASFAIKKVSYERTDVEGSCSADKQQSNRKGGAQGKSIRRPTVSILNDFKVPL